MSNRFRALPMVQPDAKPTATSIFDKVAIVGLGLIGGSLALAVRQTWPKSLVIGVDNKDALERAMVRHAIDVAADDPVVMSEADLVVLAAPVRDNVVLLSELERYVSGSAVVTDVSSTKREIVEAAHVLPSRLTFVGGHPLGGAPRSGIGHARPDLFVGRPWLFTPAADGPGAGAALERLQQFVSALGAVPHVMSTATHDRLLAVISHLPQLTVSVLMHVVGSAAGKDGLALTGRGLDDTTRLASSPASIWRDICATNGDEIKSALKTLIAELEVLRDSVDLESEIDRVFESAAAWRAVLVSQTRVKRSE